MALGSGGALAGAMIPIVSPGLRHGGLHGMCPVFQVPQNFRENSGSRVGFLARGEIRLRQLELRPSVPPSAFLHYQAVF